MGDAAQAGDRAPTAVPTQEEVWELLGRADVVVRGVLEARDAAERRLWEARARAWLRDVGQAWVRTPSPAGRQGVGGRQRAQEPAGV